MQEGPNRFTKAGLLSCLLLSILLAPGSSRAAPEVLTTVFFEQVTISGGDERSVTSPGLVLEAAGGVPLGDERVRAFLGLRGGVAEGDETRLATHLFLRASSGGEPFSTFFDLGILTRVVPSWSVGGRVGVGAQYEISGRTALFVSTGGTAGIGDRLQMALDGGVGLRVHFGASSSRPNWYVH